MKLILNLALVLVAFLVARHVIAKGRLDTDGGYVTISDVPKLLDRLRTSGRDGSFWVMLIPGTEGGDGYAANLQASIENGKIGLDWVQLAQRNIEDQAKIIDLLKARGHAPKQMRQNGVNYLRVEDPPDIAELFETSSREYIASSRRQKCSWSLPESAGRDA